MRVLLINGSAHSQGSTHTALSAVAEALREEGIDSILKQVGHLPIRGCIACGKCDGGQPCAFNDDSVNECAELLKSSDGLVVGSPVYFSGPNATLCALLDRMFYRKHQAYAYKPAAAVVSCRRGGASASFDRLNKYFTISSMPVVSSVYWNSVHGNAAEETRQDLEGLRVMRVLGKNMAWLLKCLDLAKGSIPLPDPGPKVMTNFIR